MNRFHLEIPFRLSVITCPQKMRTKAPYCIWYSVLVLFIICASGFTSFAQDFDSLIYNTGATPMSDPLVGTPMYEGVPWDFLFKSGPCTFNDISPSYGPTYMYIGYLRNPIDWGYYNTDVWGWGFDGTLAATTQNGFNQLTQEAGQNPPRNIAQVRWYERRLKRWKPNGTKYAESYVPAGTLDGNAICYADQMMEDNDTHILTAYLLSRLTYSGWHFRYWDHPGLSTLQYEYNANGNYADVALYYANFTCVFYGRDGQGNLIEIAPSQGCSVKLLLRNDVNGNCASGYQGNSAWSWQHLPSPIADWANPPVGTNFPN